MKVILIKHPDDNDWLLAKQCALVTVSKESDKVPSMEWKRKLLRSEHSPIRALWFYFRFEDLPYWVSVHLCRHVLSTPYVSTQRNDRQDRYDRNSAKQDAPVTMIWAMNAQELMTIARKRLCTKAAPETRQAVQLMCDEVLKTNPEFSGLLEPMCSYLNGSCREFEPCGRYKEYTEFSND